MAKLLLTSTIRGQLVPMFTDFIFNKPGSSVLYMPPEGDNPNNEMYFNFWKVLAKSHDCKIIFIDNTKTISEEQINQFENADGFIAPGGNTYSFLNNIKSSGYYSHLNIFLNKNNVSYLGMSAGSILVSPSIEIARDENTCGLQYFSSFGIVDTTVIVHYDLENDTRDPEDYNNPVIITDTGYALFDKDKLIKYKA